MYLSKLFIYRSSLFHPLWPSQREYLKPILPNCPSMVRFKTTYNFILNLGIGHCHICKAFIGDVKFHSPAATAQDECEECALLICKISIYQYFCVDSGSDGTARIETQVDKTPQNSLTVCSLMLAETPPKIYNRKGCSPTILRKIDNLSDHRLHPPF